MNTLIKISLRTLGLFLIVSLVSCGGSSSGDDLTTTPPQTVSANGFWEGTFTEDGVGTFSLESLLYDGRIIAISESANIIYDGSYTVSGNDFSADVIAYNIDSGTAVGTTTLSGTVTEQDSLSATFSTSYGGTGTVSLSFNDVYNLPSSLSFVAGIWNVTSGAYSLTITVENDGAFFGQDSNGCFVDGDIAIIDPAHNLYDTNVTVDVCGIFDGFYTGFSTLLNNDATLHVVVSNDNFTHWYPFTRL